jgi:hypothetical protein
MPDILFDARVRAQRYWYRDGLSEMVVGIVSLLQGGWILFNHLVNSKSSWYLPGALICLLLIAAFPVARIKAAIREHSRRPQLLAATWTSSSTIHLDSRSLQALGDQSAAGTAERPKEELER